MQEEVKSGPTEIARAIARQMIRAEHEHFVAQALDNRDHIPRVRRMARAVSTGLTKLGVSSSDATRVSDDVVAYAKELFVKEWMSEVEEGEDGRVIQAQGVAEFDRIFAAAPRFDG